MLLIGLMMVWSEGQTLAARFEQAHETLKDLRRHWKLPGTYSGWAQAMVKKTAVNKSARFLPDVSSRLGQMVAEVAPDHWRRHRWVPVAVDGTRFEAPHTEANEQGLGCAGKEKSAPQVFLTMLYHMTIGLPLGYRLGPGTDSEQVHMAEMIKQLPEPTDQTRTLLVADCGFGSYELCSRLTAAGHDFLLRIGGNRMLITDLESDTGDATRHYLWPEAKQNGEPVEVRLIVLDTDQSHPVYLITNVLDEGELTDAMAAEFYGLRWGEEVFYRTCKQTLDRRTLLSRTPETCLLEAELIVLGVWLLGLMTIRELGQAGHEPHQWSPAASRDTVRRAIRGKRCRRGRGFTSELSRAIKDTYERQGSKAARDYPRKKKQTPPKPPKIRPATPAELRKYQRLRTRQHNKPLTA